MPTEKQLHDLELINQLVEIGKPDLAKLIISDAGALDSFLIPKKIPLRWSKDIQVSIDPVSFEKNSTEIIENILVDAEQQLEAKKPLEALARLVEGVRRWFTSIVENNLSLEPLMARTEKLREISGKIAKEVGAESYSVEIFISVPPGINLAFNFNTPT